MKRPIFEKDKGNEFYQALVKKVNLLLDNKSIQKQSNTFMVCKIIFYLSLFLGFYSTLLMKGDESTSVLYLLYIGCSLSVILIVFNVSHDAAHNTLFKNHLYNKFIYYMSFTLLGNNPFVWKKYHIQSHHVYTNVEGSDIDVIKNSFIRLNKQEALKPWHKFQHVYAPFLYIFYTFNFIIIRDLQHIVGKSDRTIKISIPEKEKIKYGIYKLLYFSYALTIPLLVLTSEWQHILAAYVVSQFAASLMIVLFLGCNHQVDEIEHIAEQDSRQLPKSWATLQMETSLDYHPQNPVFNFFLGGFNAHTVHHLFPNICHVHYLKIVPLLKETANEYGITYYETSFGKALVSHFRFLKKMGHEK